MRCSNCGSNRTESDAASGTSYCIDCGTVLEENTIVAEVTFGETSGGRAILQGSFAGDSGRIAGGGLFGRNRGREGQEQALENGRQKIASLAHGLRLPERYREAAQRYYNLAVVNRFTRGRRSEHVAAVCLYAVCRSEKSAHMLIDFSDILQVNVFTLGATFLKLCRVLNLNLPHVDPSFYVSRFAVALDFGDYTQKVAQDAVRIAQRMDRDWIVTGRRPAGICGACLLIAARMNGFRRTLREMIYVVKVAEVTIQKRLNEFNQTESSKLSIRDFRTIWLEKRADPPSFQKNRTKEAALQSISKAEDGEEDKLEIDTETDGDKTVKVVSIDKDSDKYTESQLSTTEEDSSTQVDIKDDLPSIPDLIKDSQDLNESQTQIATQISVLDEEAHISTLVDQLGDKDASYVNIKNSPAFNDLSPEEKMKIIRAAREKVAGEMEVMLNPKLAEDAKEISKDLEEWMQDESVNKAAKELEKANKNKEEKDEEEEEEEEEEEDEENLSDVDCDEIEAMILTEEEVALKTKIWYNANKEYLEEMAVRRMVEKDKGGKDHKKKGGIRKKKPMSSASTPAEAAKQLVAAKKVSKKINQAVFDDMFESPESIEKIKQDSLKRKADDVDLDGYEVVEESGELPQAKVRKTDKDEEQDEDEEEDEEEEMAAPYGGYEQDHYDYEDNYYDYGDDDF
ncbi:hypothetical protein RMCBS344292_14621 [Rhizopus microsporus]|nr:hypothetical protein RMCBS344292_14621 [Rhizopus microsporus]